MISRDTYRHVKGLSREQMSKYLNQFYVSAYFEVIDDDDASIFRRLIDDFGFSDEDIARLRKGKEEDIESINQKYITAEEIINGLEAEGFKSVKGAK